jgi:hypothetical protein
VCPPSLFRLGTRQWRGHVPEPSLLACFARSGGHRLDEAGAQAGRWTRLPSGQSFVNN